MKALRFAQRLFILSLAMVIFSVFQIQAEWTIEDVESGKVKTVSGKSLAVDGTGKPHVVYIVSNANANNANPEQLKYAKRVNGAWSSQVVKSGQFSGAVIALDASGKPHIGYNEKISGTAWMGRYAKLTTTGNQDQWVFKDVWESGNELQAIALAPSGLPYFIYSTSDNRNYKIKYAKWTGTKFERGTIESAKKKVLAGSSLSIDSFGTLHLSYFKIDDEGWWNYGDVRYAKGSESLVSNLNPFSSPEPISWSIQTVGPLARHRAYSGSCCHTSLALDSSGKPHIAYFDGNTLRYAKQTGSSWSVEDTGLAPTLMSSLSLALDSLKRVHISYTLPGDQIGFNGAEEYKKGKLRYIKWQGQSWQITGGNVFGDYIRRGPSLALFGGSSHLVYIKGNPEKLKYAKYSAEGGGPAVTSTGGSPTGATTGVEPTEIKPTNIKWEFDKGPFPPIDPPKQ